MITRSFRVEKNNYVFVKCFLHRKKRTAKKHGEFSSLKNIHHHHHHVIIIVGDAREKYLKTLKFN